MTANSAAAVNCYAVVCRREWGKAGNVWALELLDPKCTSYLGWFACMPALAYRKGFVSNNGRAANIAAMEIDVLALDEGIAKAAFIEHRQFSGPGIFVVQQTESNSVQPAIFEERVFEPRREEFSASEVAFKKYRTSEDAADKFDPAQIEGNFARPPYSNISKPSLTHRNSAIVASLNGTLKGFEGSLYVEIYRCGKNYCHSIPIVECSCEVTVLIKFVTLGHGEIVARRFKFLCCLPGKVGSKSIHYGVCIEFRCAGYYVPQDRYATDSAGNSVLIQQLQTLLEAAGKFRELSLLERATAIFNCLSCSFRVALTGSGPSKQHPQREKAGDCPRESDGHTKPAAIRRQGWQLFPHASVPTYECSGNNAGKRQQAPFQIIVIAVCHAASHVVNGEGLTALLEQTVALESLL